MGAAFSFLSEARKQTMKVVDRITSVEARRMRERQERLAREEAARLVGPSARAHRHRTPDARSQ